MDDDAIRHLLNAVGIETARGESLPDLPGELTAQLASELLDWLIEHYDSLPEYAAITSAYARSRARLEMATAAGCHRFLLDLLGDEVNSARERLNGLPEVVADDKPAVLQAFAHLSRVAAGASPG